MRQSQGDYLNGINQIASLAAADTPENQKALGDLKQRPDYWHGVYPLPYAGLIQTWATQRQLNPLLVVALIRQESHFSPKIRSGVGATGLMQVMPDTAKWIQASAGLASYDLTHPEDNIRLGTWYLDHTHAEYRNHSLFRSPVIMLALAMWLSGSGRVATGMPMTLPRKFLFPKPGATSAPSLPVIGITSGFTTPPLLPRWGNWPASD
ncbi:MAG: transglycosylase SLT domain-containing protein [Nodosilinea sp. LVE1205-7]|jgi:soluble lytic murein transglycosylase